MNPFKGPEWFPYWKDCTIVLVASGPSAIHANLELVRDRYRVVTVNNSWKLAPWADVLYGCDGTWWRSNEGVPDFKGLKMTIDRRTCEDYPNWQIHKVECDRSSDKLAFGRVNHIGWGGNSGFGALNLSVQFGAKRIILVGFDMNLENGSHWHGDHTGPLGNPREGNIARWRRVFDEAFYQLKSIGVEAINTSLTSSLRNYPRLTFEEATQ